MEGEKDPKSSMIVAGDDQSQKKNPSPYDLNSNDNPGSVIMQVQLRGENYDEWSRAVKTSLRARRKWGFIDGTIKNPEEES
ncbi:receptor-like serine/threonine kinase, partial [Trifolium medium]|nr:receptor-like serine/threonine kinase [Trifolium medium]